MTTTNRNWANLYSVTATAGLRVDAEKIAADFVAYLYEFSDRPTEITTQNSHNYLLMAAMNQKHGISKNYLIS